MKEALAAQGSSSTEPYPNGDDMLEYYRALRHRHFHRLSEPTRFPEVCRHNAYAQVMDDILMLFVGGVLSANGAHRGGGFGGDPASEEAMAALPHKTVGQIMGEEEECAVCLEAYEAGDTVRTMPCSHGFHEHCIFRWLRVSRLCPLCRLALPLAAAAETESSFMGEQDPSASDSS